MNYAMYLPTIGEFSDPTVLAELAHEAEESRWDGVFIWDTLNYALTPGESVAARILPSVPRSARIGCLFGPGPAASRHDCHVVWYPGWPPGPALTP